MSIQRRFTLLSCLCVASLVQAQAPGGAMPPTPVETAKPRVESVVDQATAVGSLRANEAVVIRPEVAGRIESIAFEEGARVQRLREAIAELREQALNFGRLHARPGNEADAEEVGRAAASGQL